MSGTSWGGHADPAVNVYQWLWAIAPHSHNSMPSDVLSPDMVPGGAATLRRADALFAGSVHCNLRSARFRSLHRCTVAELRAMPHNRSTAGGELLKRELVLAVLEADTTLQWLRGIANGYVDHDVAA